jgi:hypothetical protein
MLRIPLYYHSLLRENVEKIFWGSRSSEGGKKKFPAENSEESDSVHLTDQLSNFGIIPDYLKVVDFVEEMGDLLTKIVQREISTFTMVDPSEV